LIQYSERVKFINLEIMPVPFGYTNVVEVRSVRTIYVSGQVVLNKDGYRDLGV
jgi:hypothetical protein